MSEPKKCSGCGGEIPKDALFGLCRSCVLAGTLEQNEAPHDHAHRCFAGYELGRQIGRGGMGVVYQAIQLSLRRPVALKMILDSQVDSEVARRRFKIEAEAAAKLDHPNIVPIYEVGEQDEHPFLSMKLVEGESLRHQIARGSLCVTNEPGAQTKGQHRGRREAAVRLMVTIARAVHHAHQHGVLHRDLKPGNILIDAGGAPHLTDFGLAKILELSSEDTQSLSLTLSGDAMGTPSYMSPEQASGQHLSAASDIYSLGAILYELLTGQPPFMAATPLETLRLVTTEEVKRPSTVCSGIDKDLDTICTKCLEKKPQNRYHSAEAMAGDLERWLHHRPIQARPTGFIFRVGRWTRRNPVGAALIVTLFGALVLASVLLRMAAEKQWLSDIQKANLIDMVNQQVEELWQNPNKPYVHIYSSQLAALAYRTPRGTSPDAVKLVFSLHINDDPLGQARRYAPLLGLLEEKMEKTLQRQVVLDLRLFKSLFEPFAVQDEIEQSDFRRMGPLTYVRLREAGIKLEPVVRERDAKEAVIFARKELAITNLSQTVGRRVAFAHTNAIISFRAKVLLARAGITAANLKSCENLDVFKGQTKLSSGAWEGDLDPEIYAHREVVERVLANDFDVGEAQRKHFEMNKHKGRGLVELCAFPVLPNVYVARAALPPEYIEAFRQSLTSLKNKPEKALLGRLQASPIDGFEPITDHDFDEVRSALTNEVKRFEAVPAG